MDTTPRSFGTHDGTFHADEVTACALLLLFDCIDRDRVIRTRDPKLLEKCEYVCDVGGIYDSEKKRFDHHQSQYDGPLSSAGMVLLYLKEQGIVNENAYRFFKNVLISGVDDHDNGKDPQIIGLCSYSHVISNFTPISYDSEEEDYDAAFSEALDFAEGHLRRVWERYQYSQSCKQIVETEMQNSDEYLVFEKAIPWLELFFELGGETHPAQFLVMPSGNHWKLRGIPPNYQQRMQVRFPLPKEWAGLLTDDLKRVSGISGAVFCHKGRFISVWETREDAMKALDYVMKKVRGEK